jgi:hypothetical protein
MRSLRPTDATQRVTVGQFADHSGRMAKGPVNIASKDCLDRRIGVPGQGSNNVCASVSVHLGVGVHVRTYVRQHLGGNVDLASNTGGDVRDRADRSSGTRVYPTNDTGGRTHRAHDGCIDVSDYLGGKMGPRFQVEASVDVGDRISD